jgi:Zn-finger domain-containing protein
MPDKYKTIRIRVNEEEYLEFLKYKSLGLSERATLEATCRPCDRCENTEVIVFNKKNESVKVKRGILLRKTNQLLYNK